MNALHVVLSVAVLVALVIGVFCYRYFRSDGSPRWTSFSGSVMVFLIAGFFLIVAGALQTGRVPANSVIAREGVILENFNTETSLWRWDGRFKGSKILAYVPPAVQMSVNPITDNPKVRQLRYDVTVEIRTNPIAFPVYWEEVEMRGGGLEPWLKRQLYDFNEEHSKELAKFWNPFREEQQRDFETLVRLFLAPRITVKNPTGLETSGFLIIRNARFSLP